MGDGYFYTLSAIAQSFAAIVALNGIFVIYKLQILKSRRDELLVKLQRLWIEDYVTAGPGRSRDLAKSELEKITNETLLNWAQKHSDRDAIVNEKERVMGEYKECGLFSKKIMNSFPRPLILNGITITGSLLLLPWKNFVPCTVRMLIVIPVLLFATFSLWVTIRSTLFTFHQQSDDV